MIFNSFPFLVFIVVFFPLYFYLKGRLRLLFCLASSYFFYGWWDYRFLTLIVFSTTLDFFIGRKLEESTLASDKKKYLLTSVIVNLSVLGFFKYFNFFLDSATQLAITLGFNVDRLHLPIVLPVGISFYTFQAMSYSIDVYRAKIKAEKDYITFATYIAFFPQLMAGPIVRAIDFLPQLKTDKKFSWINFEIGLIRVLFGFFKKVVVADSLALLVDSAFLAPDKHGSLYLILGIVFYSFQIYCDFSGYSDIAIGLARMMGFHFPTNFNLPYFSRSFSEFWTRWHITLSSWLRDYLYISLGGNRKGVFKTYRNLMVTMLLGGLWHGANYTFIIWGFLHGTYLIIQRLLDPVFNPQKKGPLPFFFSLASGLLVYTSTCFAWIFFRSPDLVTALEYVKGIVSFSDMSFSKLPNQLVVAKGLFLVFFLVLVEALSIKVNYFVLLVRKPIVRLGVFLFILWSIALIGTFLDSQFIYFQF